MNLNFASAGNRAEAVIHNLVAANPSVVVALVVFGGFLVVSALDARDKVRTAVKHQLTAHGIDLLFPTQPILFHDQAEDSEEDRGGQPDGYAAGQADVPASRKVPDAIAQISRPKPRPVDGE